MWVSTTLTAPLASDNYTNINNNSTNQNITQTNYPSTINILVDFSFQTYAFIFVMPFMLVCFSSCCYLIKNKCCQPNIRINKQNKKSKDFRGISDLILHNANNRFLTQYENPLNSNVVFNLENQNSSTLINNKSRMYSDSLVKSQVVKIDEDFQEVDQYENSQFFNKFTIVEETDSAKTREFV